MKSTLSIKKIVKIAHREDKKRIGTHIVADFWDCDFNDNADHLRKLLINAAHVSNATVLGSVVHQFEPEGSTALVLLAESHISAHTWPEYGYIAIDIFTCGHNMKPEVAIDYLKAALKPKKIQKHTLSRGEDKKNDRKR